MPRCSARIVKIASIAPARRRDSAPSPPSSTRRVPRFRPPRATLRTLDSPESSRGRRGSVRIDVADVFGVDAGAPARAPCARRGPGSGPSDRGPRRDSRPRRRRSRAVRCSYVAPIAARDRAPRSRPSPPPRPSRIRRARRRTGATPVRGRRCGAEIVRTSPKPGDPDLLSPEIPYRHRTSQRRGRAGSHPCPVADRHIGGRTRGALGQQGAARARDPARGEIRDDLDDRERINWAVELVDARLERVGGLRCRLQRPRRPVSAIALLASRLQLGSVARPRAAASARWLNWGAARRLVVDVLRHLEILHLTGIGMVSPLGNTVDGTWQALIDGKSGAGPITQFDSTDFPGICL